MIITSETSDRNDALDQLEEEFACARRLHFHSSLHEMGEHRWITGWKPTFESWEIHAVALPEKTERMVYLESFQTSVKMHWYGEIDVVESLPANLAEVLGNDFAQITELRRAVTSLPDAARSRVFSAIASIANRIRAEAEPRAETEETLLDSFRGWVEKIAEGIAYVKFVDQNDGVSYAQIEAADLAKEGISEAEAFLCEIKAKNGETAMTLRPMPKKKLSAADYAEIERELDEALPDSHSDENEK